MKHIERNVLSWNKLSIYEARSLLLLNDLTVRKIFLNSIRKVKIDITDEEVESAWREIVRKAKEIGIKLARPKNFDELKDAIVKMVIMEFPNT